MMTRFAARSPPASPGSALLRTLDRYQAALDRHSRTTAGGDEYDGHPL